MRNLEANNALMDYLIVKEQQNSTFASKTLLYDTLHKMALNQIHNHERVLYLPRIDFKEQLSETTAVFDNRFMKDGSFYTQPQKINIYYLTVDNILEINHRVEPKFGGVKDIDGLKAVIAQAQNGMTKQHFYPTVFEVANYYFNALASKQLFNNSNKRTALASMLFFLYYNGYVLRFIDKVQLDNFVKAAVDKEEGLKNRLIDYMKQYSDLFVGQFFIHLPRTIILNEVLTEPEIKDELAELAKE